MARLEAETAMVKQQTAQMQKVSTFLQKSIEAYKRAMCDHLNSLLESFDMHTALNEGQASVHLLLSGYLAHSQSNLCP